MASKRLFLPLLLSLLLAAGCSGTRPSNLGARNGRFISCPSSANCVSSQAAPDDAEHYVEPLAYEGSAVDAMERLVGVLTESLSRIEVVTRTEDYIHAEATSFLFRFVDDVEFYFPPDAKLIHCRSASRLGASDFGVNRGRIEEIRAALAEAE